MSNDPVYKEVKTNHGGQESPDSARQISDAQKSTGYGSPSAQEWNESGDHYNERKNSW